MTFVRTSLLAVAAAMAALLRGENVWPQMRSVPFDPLMGRDDKYDARRAVWLGSTNRETSLCVAWHTAPFKTLADAIDRQMVLGTIGEHDRRLAGIGGRRDPGIEPGFGTLGERSEAERRPQAVRRAVPDQDQEQAHEQQQQGAQGEGIVEVGARGGRADPQFLQEDGEACSRDGVRTRTSEISAIASTSPKRARMALCGNSGSRGHNPASDRARNRPATVTISHARGQIRSNSRAQVLRRTLRSNARSRGDCSCPILADRCLAAIASL